jgi:hypothetical protein
VKTQRGGGSAGLPALSLTGTAILQVDAEKRAPEATGAIRVIGGKLDQRGGRFVQCSALLDWPVGAQDTRGMAKVLILPGLGDSGPDHWQSHWERANPTWRRVRQRDWDRPAPAEWHATLERYIGDTGSAVTLVAHSLGCALVARWAGTSPRAGDVTGALLVAPSDVDSAAHTPEEVRGFAPMPREPLPFLTIVIASRNDPYVDFERARDFAGWWGARFVDAGKRGHMNSESGLGEWPEGQRHLRELGTT